MAEETLGAQVARFQAAQNKTRNTDYPAYLPTQNAIDRARTFAQSGMRRAKADLDKMQAARRKTREKPAPTIRTQSQPVPEPPAPSLPPANPSTAAPSEIA
jgi:hypothetical protein